MNDIPEDRVQNKRTINRQKKIFDALETEVKVSEHFQRSSHNSPQTFLDVCFVDLAEGFAGVARAT